VSRAGMGGWMGGLGGEVRAKTGQEPIIYTAPPWWQQCTGGVSKFRQLPLWVPDLNSTTSPILPAGWTKWAFWQYSSTGTVNGIPALRNTDLDQLNPGRIPLLDPGAQNDAVGSAVNVQVAPPHPLPRPTLSSSPPRLPPGPSRRAGGLRPGPRATAGQSRVRGRASNGKGLSGAVSFGWKVN